MCSDLARSLPLSARRIKASGGPQKCLTKGRNGPGWICKSDCSLTRPGFTQPPVYCLALSISRFTSGSLMIV